MTKLSNSTVWRGGITSDYVHRELGAVPRLGAFNTMVDADEHIGIQLTTHIASKGGGTTTVVTKIDRRDFMELAAQMLHADRDGAIDAFANAILRVRSPELP
uniref:hypothetical protein n=1 Tax=Ensifer adhaerens TaxID=106592 RepID=UPI003F4914D9